MRKSPARLGTPIVHANHAGTFDVLEGLNGTEAKGRQDISRAIENLINNNALQISDRTKAEAILSTVNYYRLSAYGIGLMQPNDKEKYLPGITLEHIYHLYQFDSGLRNILTPLVEYVEIAFRTRLAYQLAIAYGAEGYRDSMHFSQKTDRNGNSIYQKTMDQLDTEIKHQQNLPCVKHHMAVYGGHFPIWAAMELFSAASVWHVLSTMSAQIRIKRALLHAFVQHHNNCMAGC